MSERWRELAACRGMDTNIFFPTRGEDSTVAKALCAGCPVREECWQGSIEAHSKHGIWGGLSSKQRRARRQAEGIKLLPDSALWLAPPPSHSPSAVRQRATRARKADTYASDWARIHAS